MRIAVVLLALLASCAQFKNHKHEGDGEGDDEAAKKPEAPVVRDVEDGNDWNKWWCSTDRCDRSRGDCEFVLADAKRGGYARAGEECVRYLRAACFSHSDPLRGGTFDTCAPSMGDCRSSRDFLIANPKGAEDIKQCEVRD